MPRVSFTGLLHCSRGRISGSRKNKTCSPTSEKAMILFTSSTQNIAAPAAGGWSVRAIVRDMLNAWFAHHQRLADLGIGGDL
jgi:hypothetical protein